MRIALPLMGIVLSITTMLFVSACSKKDSVSVGTLMAAADTLRQDHKYSEAIGVLEEIPTKFPEDTSGTIKAWVTAADICGGDLQNFAKSIEYHEKIMNRFPEDPQSPKSLLIVALTYEQQLQDTEKARHLYEEFLKKYPNHEIAESVRANLALLDLSEEELNKRLESAGSAP